MKSSVRTITSTLSLYILVMQGMEEYALQGTELQLISQHTSCNHTKELHKKYKNYINSSLPHDQQVEYAYLFDKFIYHFDDALDLAEFHQDPLRATNNKLGETLSELTDAYKSTTQRIYDKKIKFKLAVINIARLYGAWYCNLPIKEREVAQKQKYSSNGIYRSQRACMVFDAIENTQKKLQEHKIYISQKKIADDAQEIAQNFRNAHCQEYDKLTEYQKIFHGHTKHKSVYAELLLHYVKAVHKYLEQ